MSGLKDWQVGAMWEADAARQWEEENKDVDLRESITEVGYAMDYAGSLAEWLGKAANDAKGSVFEARIMSVFEDLERLQDDMTSLKARMEEEARKSA